MRILGHMVTRNEDHRYLRQAVASLQNVCNAVAVFDDASTDRTVSTLLAAGVHVDVRENSEPSFLEHEGRFRQLAWSWMEDVLDAEPGDWILSLDADELVLADQAIYAGLQAIPAQVDSLIVDIREVWSLMPPMQRVDGYWGKIAGARLCRWRSGAQIADKPMASGSVPPGYSIMSDVVTIAHLGYVRREDREAKHARYAGRDGHASKHVDSILQKPTLVRIEGVLL